MFSATWTALQQLGADLAVARLRRKESPAVLAALEADRGDYAAALLKRALVALWAANCNSLNPKRLHAVP